MKKRFYEIKQKLTSPYGLYLFCLFCIYILGFEQAIMKLDFPIASVLRNLLPILAILFFIYTFPDKKPSRSMIAYIICFLVFTVSGLTGWFLHHYQTFSVTLHGMYEHIRFWLCLYLFAQIGRHFPLERYARRLHIHIASLSAFFFILTVLDVNLHIWGRQIYRNGVGSIQLFFGHPSNLGARTVLLVALLCLLFPYLKKESGRLSVSCVINVSLTVAMLWVTVRTLRIRLYGFVIFFAVLYVFMILLKLKLHLPVVIAGALGALLIGWQRLYNFYFSPNAMRMARGQLTVNSLKVAAEAPPFGGGFGTFGSRITQIHYSPLYYKYNMMLTLGLSPEYSNYACDTFFPVILAESGWLGFCAYLGLIVILLLTVFDAQRKLPGTAEVRHLIFTVFILVAYEILEATGTLAFSEIYSAFIALPLGIAAGRLARMKEAAAAKRAADPVRTDK